MDRKGGISKISGKEGGQGGKVKQRRRVQDHHEGRDSGC